jgi:hypothetical protein
MGKTLILKSLLRSPNSISFMLIIFTFKLIQTIRILWFCHRSKGRHNNRCHGWRQYAAITGLLSDTAPGEPERVGGLLVHDTESAIAREVTMFTVQKEFSHNL